jgi:hypothetical protein
VNVSILHGALRTEWVFVEEIFSRPEIEAAAERFIRIVTSEAARFEKARPERILPDRHRLPSRFGAGEAPIVDAYPLSPIQQGILFHSSAPQANLYVEQFSCVFAGDLDPDRFARVWQRLIDRHTLLRTAFVEDAQGRAVQVVLGAAALRIERDDWSHLEEAAQQEKMADLLGIEGGRPLDPARAPVMRMWLIRTGQTSHRFLWTYHHLLLDGWSLALLFREFFLLYGAADRATPEELPPARPFRHYIDWLIAKDPIPARAFWRRRLAGVSEPTSLPPPPRERRAGHGEENARLDRGQTRSLLQSARRHGVTVSALIHGAWAILLSRYSSD